MQESHDITIGRVVVATLLAAPAASTAVIVAAVALLLSAVALLLSAVALLLSAVALTQAFSCRPRIALSGRCNC